MMTQEFQRMHARRLSSVLAALSVLAMATALPAKAQTTATPSPQAEADKCVARPDQDPQRQQPDAQGQTTPTTTQKLANCDSVLRPPAVGDPEMVEPAPPVGDTPVIKPGELPPEQSQ